MDFCSKVSSGCLNDFGVMVSTSNSNRNESSDVTIMSLDKEDMAGPTCSVSRLHTLDKDETDAVSTPKEDKTKNDCTARKVYQHYRKRTSTRRDVTVSTLSVKDKVRRFNAIYIVFFCFNFKFYYHSACRTLDNLKFLC